MTTPQSCPECGVEITDAEATACPGCLLKTAANDSTADASLAPTIQSGNSRFEAPKPEQIDSLFPNLDVLELIGRGGMGAVYKARQLDLDRVVAVKILPREMEGDPTFGERFLREARTLAKLNHPNIVSVFDFGQAENLFYFVMEFVDGVTLRDTIASGAVSPEEALRIIPELCDALQFAHEEGVVHRDIKPENILLSRKGQVKIADFGLAKLVQGEDESPVNLTETHQVMGTVKYMAPEQMSTSKDVDHRADIYSLGVIFYELLTGELPIGWFAPPSKKVAVDVRMDEVVLRALESEPSRRFQHASEIKTAVQSLATVIPSSPSSPLMAGDIRLHKLLDETKTGNRGMQQTLLGFAIMIAFWAILAVFMTQIPWYISAASIVVAFILSRISKLLKKNQVWETRYKGHTIRMDNSGLWAERLYLDDGLVQTGGFGTKMEFRFSIKAGDGIGDEVAVWFDAATKSARCRIEVEEKLA